MSRENVEVVRNLCQHWARGDLAFSDPFDPDVEFSRTAPEGSGVSGRWLGLKEVSAGFGEYVRAFTEFRLEAERIIDLDDERVLVFSRHTGRGKRSGVPTEHELGELFTVRDGKIVRVDFYWDRAEAFEVAGLKGSGHVEGA
ncbi:MAG: nuclear transport factor 2 family protein [Solirubrobacterales bacterium]